MPLSSVALTWTVISPIIIGSCETDYATSVFVKDNYAFIAENFEGLKVIDISNPETPTTIGACETDFANGVFVKDNYAYIAGGHVGLKIIQIIE